MAKGSPAVVPEPGRPTALLGQVSYVIVRVPVKLPAAAGVKKTSRASSCPGPNVAGPEKPLRAKGEAVLAEVTVNAVEPGLEMVTICAALVLPTAWFPKRSAGGLAPIPVPDKDTNTGERVALLLKLNCPLKAWGASGPKATVKVALAPGLKEKGVRIAP